MVRQPVGVLENVVVGIFVAPFLLCRILLHVSNFQLRQLRRGRDSVKPGWPRPLVTNVLDLLLVQYGRDLALYLNKSSR